MGRDSPPMYPMSDVGRGSSRQDLLYTNPGVFLPPPSSSLTNDVHVWSPLGLHHPSFPRSSPGAHQSGPWSSALLSAYMMHLLPQHHHLTHAPESRHHSPPHKPLAYMHEPPLFTRPQGAPSGTADSPHSQTPSPPSRSVGYSSGRDVGEKERKAEVDSD